MENKINIACFKEGSRTAEVKDIWQWDYGQILRIQGLNLPTAVEIHFSLDEHGGEAARRIGVTKDGVTDVPIPDTMVENESAYGDSYYFFAYVYLADEESGNTEYKIRAKVSTRSKPEGFVKPCEKELFYDAIEATRESLAGSREAAELSEAWAHGRDDYPDRVEDNAAYYAASAHDSMVETQHLAERVHSDADATARNAALAEQYKSQAAKSAADALQSEQNAKASETAAQEAQAGAETAEGQAELFAAQAEEDKNTVEQAKAVVMEIGQKVEDNKKTVEQTVDNFELLHEQAVADVNNAGQAQTERVNESGETAVDNIEFLSKQAVQYVANEGATQVANVQAAAEEIAGKVEQIENNAQGITELKTDLLKKQDELVSGQNIKTMNGQSILGSGNIVTSGAMSQKILDTTLDQDVSAWIYTGELHRFYMFVKFGEMHSSYALVLEALTDSGYVVIARFNNANSNFYAAVNYASINGLPMVQISNSASDATQIAQCYWYPTYGAFNPDGNPHSVTIKGLRLRFVYAVSNDNPVPSGTVIKMWGC